MTADFVNAYILGSVGATGANVGACATFLYNLRQGITDIRAGNCRVAVIGSSEAPITPEVIEGYRTMGALAEDDALLKLDGQSQGRPDHARACRPFAENCGFTLAEASQFVILFDDELALEMGANIYGSVADVFVNADGFKKSIPGPRYRELPYRRQSNGRRAGYYWRQGFSEQHLHAGARHRHAAKQGDGVTHLQCFGEKFWYQQMACHSN